MNTHDRLLEFALPTALLWWHLAINARVLWAYWHDKRAAINGRWRTPQFRLQLYALAGGWPAAWLARQLWRHKTRKAGFTLVLLLASLTHALALSALLVFIYEVSP